MKLTEALESYLNGNITDAKAALKPKHFTLRKIADKLQAEFGYSEHKAIMTAYHIKGQCSFQEACDAV